MAEKNVVLDENLANSEVTSEVCSYTDSVLCSSRQDHTTIDKEIRLSLPSINLPLSKNISPASEVANVITEPFDGAVRGNVSDSELQTGTSISDEDQILHSDSVIVVGNSLNHINKYHFKADTNYFFIS